MWQLLFWGSVSVVFYIYAGYPALLYILGRLRKHKTRKVDQDLKPTVCLIISAFNEEKVLSDKIQNSLSLQYPADKLTILVASDGSTDRTVNIVEEFSDYGVRLYHGDRRRGKSAVLNDVVKDLTQDIIVFTDANALFARDAIGKLARNFADPSVGCVVGKLRYVDREASSVGKAEGVYWRYEGLISRLESNLKSVLVANGSIFAIRRGLFRELYPEVANDLQIPIDIASGGLGVVYEPQAEATERTTEYWREEFQRKVRIILRGMTGFTMLRNKIRGFRLWQFWSHKVLRWAVGLFLIAAFVANVALAGSAMIYKALLAGQVLFYAAALTGWGLRRIRKPWKLINIPFYFTAVNYAAMTGIIKFMLGQRLTVWEKAESTRLTSATPLQPESAGSRAEVDSAGRGQPRAEVDSVGRGQPHAEVDSVGRTQPRRKVAKN